MFLADNKKTKDEPMSDHQFYSILMMAGLGVPSLWIWKHFNAIQFWFFQNFVTIGVCLLCLILGFIYFLRIKNNSLPHVKRMRLLSKIWNSTDGVYAGETKDGCDIHVPESTRTGHVQILGATGRGKTESVIIPWFLRDLDNGHSTLLIDGKGDRDLLKKITPWIDKIPSRPKLFVFDLGHPEKSMCINPLKVGTPQQLTDRLFQSLEFSDQFYQAVQFEIAGQLIELIHEVDKTVTLREVYMLLTDDNALADKISKSKNEHLCGRLTAFLSEPKKDRDIKTKGLIAQLSPFAAGELSALVNGGKDEFSLSELLTSNKSELKEKFKTETVAIVILLPTLLYQQMALKLGKMILQELAWVVAARKEAVFTPVFLDEFSAFVYEGFGQLLNKARSSGIALHLSHQSLGDLEVVSSGFAQSVNANTNVKCLLGLNDPTTADFFAKHLGTISQEKFTERMNSGGLFGSHKKTGEMSVREVEAYRIHPNELKHLMNGDGVIQFSIPDGLVLERLKFARLPEVI